METTNQANISQIKYVFNVLDVTGRGYLTAKELSFMMRAFGYDNSVEEIQSLIDALSPGGLGMNFGNFCTALLWKPNTAENEIGYAGKSDTKDDHDEHNFS
ncbi:GH24983 [Drosophila grimshawi]|uniref:GH24983 n=1 Tax=Drosophila grimshawi TaxID=7222 RepID=B4K3P4_DROGR|nr:GH24983 [Drosophila grimshawi]